jgi:uncharacterized protein YdeI (BOF family)
MKKSIILCLLCVCATFTACSSNGKDSKETTTSTETVSFEEKKSEESTGVVETSQNIKTNPASIEVE